MTDDNRFTTAQIKVHVAKSGTWVRLAHMLVLALAAWLAIGLLWATAIVQFLSQLLTGAPIERLSRFGTALAAYLSDAVLFLTFGSDHKPFPYAPLPEMAESDKDGHATA
jgi:Domain of unknown function (DUF4389)